MIVGGSDQRLFSPLFSFLEMLFFVSHFFPLEFSTICSQATHTTRWSNVTHFSKVKKSRLAEYSIKQYCQTRWCEMLLPVLLIINLYLFLLLEMISAHVLDHIISEYSIKQYCQTRECEMLLPVLLIINLYLFLLLEMISAHVLDHIISERNLLIAM